MASGVDGGTLVSFLPSLRVGISPNSVGGQRVQPFQGVETDYSGVVGNLREVLAGQCTYCHHCLPCPEGIEIGWVIWDLDQIPAKGIEQVKEWYAGFPVKASACVECGVCVERCPYDVDIIAKMHEATKVFEAAAA